MKWAWRGYNLYSQRCNRQLMRICAGIKKPETLHRHLYRAYLHTVCLALGVPWAQSLTVTSHLSHSAFPFGTISPPNVLPGTLLNQILLHWFLLISVKLCVHLPRSLKSLVWNYFFLKSVYSKIIMHNVCMIAICTDVQKKQFQC